MYDIFVITNGKITLEKPLIQVSHYDFSDGKPSLRRSYSLLFAAAFLSSAPHNQSPLLY